jgi:hypothetical protein
LKLVKKLNIWSKKREKFGNVVIWIKASSEFFETAEFQNFLTKKYVTCPYGSFEHFKKIILKKGLKYYLPFLKSKKLFYVRTKKYIPPSEIFKITEK